MSLSLRTRAALFRRRVARAAGRALGRNATTYVQERTSEYRGYWEGAAARIGADFTALSDSIWEVRRGTGRVRLANYVTSADDPVTLRIAGDKALCLRRVVDLGIPVPLHGVFSLGSLSRAREFVDRHGGAFAVKPVSGSASALGVSTNLTEWRGVREAALLAALFNPEFLVERMVPAESCRLLFLGGELIHAVRRTGVRVTGDGTSTLSALAAAAGSPADETMRLTLEHQGLAPVSVPAAGTEVVVRCLPAGLRAHPELRTVYDQTITDRIGPELREQAGRIVRSIGSEFAGVDVLTNDPSVSLEQARGVFLELNTTPGIHHHYHTPHERETHPVAVRVLEYLLERGAPVAEGVV